MPLPAHCWVKSKFFDTPAPLLSIVRPYRSVSHNGQRAFEDCHPFGLSARIGAVTFEPCLEDWCVSEETDKDRAALGATMVARIESEGLGSPTREKAITDALNAIDGVQEVSIENGAIHVTYDPVQTSEKKIEESIRASGISVTSAATDSETPRPVTGPGLAARANRA